jgi:hypothetical protein
MGKEQATQPLMVLRSAAKVAKLTGWPTCDAHESFFFPLGTDISKGIPASCGRWKHRLDWGHRAHHVERHPGKAIKSLLSWLGSLFGVVPRWND